MMHGYKNVIPWLIERLSSRDLSYQCIKSLGYIATTDKTPVLETLIKDGLMKKVDDYFDISLSGCEKEIFWMMSNVAVTNSEFASLVSKSKPYEQALRVIKN
jgi:hypothetical protein